MSKTDFLKKFNQYIDTKDKELLQELCYSNIVTSIIYLLKSVNIYNYEKADIANMLYEKLSKSNLYKIKSTKQINSLLTIIIKNLIINENKKQNKYKSNTTLLNEELIYESHSDKGQKQTENVLTNQTRYYDDTSLINYEKTIKYLEEHDILKKYIIERYTLQELADEYNVSTTAIYKRINKEKQKLIEIVNEEMK